MTEILYIEHNSSCPYIYTESSIIKNIASVCGIDDIAVYLAGSRPMAYFDEEYQPFIALLDSTGIEYTVVYKDVGWFYDKEGVYQ